MNLLSSDGENTPPSGGYTLREVVENMQKLGGLVEIIGVAMKRCDDAEINRDTAEEFAWEAGSLVERLGVRALELLDAEATPSRPEKNGGAGAPVSRAQGARTDQALRRGMAPKLSRAARTPRERTARPRVA